ncbi:hydrogenase/urease accessory protein HupE [Neorhizobium huautlense]|uniref:Hydrogenase/urease accessory protein HupE n=1 Tax=Neorhizobium huautlense TaxID=67774 RepID=A0ABT9PP41_9HYPH|nr:HupE/UreJ family protein [Neorhizobium huautlense]MDP9835464.1 hydrogenase/urease accessory protein HupE [Neorhizobium huautlense]
MAKRNWCICFFIALLGLLPSLPALAHEIGTTSVRLTLGVDKRWSVEVTTAPTILINRLEGERNLPLSRDLTEAQARARLQMLLPVLAPHMQLRFGPQAVEVEPAIAEMVIPDDITLPAFVTLRANGPVPAQAETLSWRYELVFSTYGFVVVDELRGISETQWLEGNQESKPFAMTGNVEKQPLSGLMLQYLELGFLHILPEGLDHILFVLGIFLLSPHWRPILVQVTAFTLAHSVTLGLSMYGIVSLPSHIVEPLIALSVAYVAIENIATRNLSPWRPVVVFCFGLLHGLRFAGALQELQLPRADIIPALISFNIGIELAQLAIIAIAYFGFAVWFQRRNLYRPYMVIPASVIIAAIGLFWTAERVLEL